MNFWGHHIILQLNWRLGPSVGIVVPREGIDQRTKDATGKACYGTLTHCVMLENHTCHRVFFDGSSQLEIGCNPGCKML